MSLIIFTFLLEHIIATSSLLHFTSNNKHNEIDEAALAGRGTCFETNRYQFKADENKI